ncbi:MAG: aldo/keto reductase [Asgard group archaeon]|nr:aldo/keto reductase [Asgard group archaeon]
MKKRKIGRINKEVSAIGMGCFAIGGPFYRSTGGVLAYGQVDDEESIKAIHKAIDMGVNVFDTADIYGVGRSEKVLGKALKDYRDDIVIATKFASRFEEGNPISLAGKGTSTEYIRRAIRDSFRRLQTDFIDIYQFHSSDYPIEESIKVRNTLDDLVQEGLIGSFGWSTDDVERAKFFAESNNCVAIQYALNLTHHNRLMIKFCEEENLSGLIRSPFASGTLTGKYGPDTKIQDDHMLSRLDFSDERRRKILSKLQDLKEILTEDGRSLIQGQLSWILAQSKTIIPIPGAKNVKQIKENAGTLELEPLKSDVVDKINELFQEFITEGVLKSSL